MHTVADHMVARFPLLFTVVADLERAGGSETLSRVQLNVKAVRRRYFLFLAILAVLVTPVSLVAGFAKIGVAFVFVDFAGSAPP